MTSAENFVRNVGNIEISRKDLQLLLQQKLGAQVMVYKFRTSSLLPPGENFACSILEIYAVIKKNENAPEEELNLVAKMFPTEDIMRKIFDFSFFFKKEIFFYKKLIPIFQQLEIDFGAQNKEIFDIGPKIFGTRYSADSNAEVVDDSTIILMENLKMNGYYTLDKIEGLDLNHSRMVIKTLARFHALGIACKHHRPEFFKTEILAHAKIVPFQQVDDTKDLFDEIFNKMCEDPRIAKYRENIYSLLGPKTKSIYFEYLANEPWLSIAHFDIWTNNILFHKDDQGDLDDIKMIDFQNYTYNSPLRDLPYFLCTSISAEVFIHKFDELLDLYYETFIEVLKKMHCNIEPFSLESFHAQLKIDSSLEFFHSIMAIKFFYAKINKNTYDASQIESIIINSQLSAAGYNKWYDIVMKYLKKGWM